MMKAATESPLYAYVVLSLLTGARTEEFRALRWCEVDIAGNPEGNPSVPPSISVLRSVRAGGDTKTRRSRRALAMPHRCVEALSALWTSGTVDIQKARHAIVLFLLQQIESR